MERNDSARAARTRRAFGYLGLWLALGLWALLIAAGSAAALAADLPPAFPLITTVQGTGEPPQAGPVNLAASGSIAAPSASIAAMARRRTAPIAPGQTEQQPVARDAAADETGHPEGVLGSEPPTRVRVAILNATGKPGGANKVAVLLGEYKRLALEDQIGMQIEVVNLSTAENVRPGQSILFYRPPFLRAALAMATAIPGNQLVEPMRPAGLKRVGVDVEIVVGQELP